MGVVYSFPRIVKMATSPTIADNENLGYLAGTLWIDTSANGGDGLGYVCIYSDTFTAQWRVTSLNLGDYSIEVVDGKVRLENDQVTPPAGIHYYGTDTLGVKGWHSLGGVAAEELEIIASSSSLYRLLLHDSTYEKCHYNLFGSPETSATSGTFVWSGSPVTYTPNLYTYEVSSGSVLTTVNVIEQGETESVSTDSFYAYVETNVPYVAEYSTDNNIWREFFPTSVIDGETLTELPRVELGDTYTTLYIRTTFDSRGSVLSYGCLYDEEAGVYSYYSEAFFDIHYYYLEGASATSYSTSGSAELSGANWQTELEFYGQGLLNTTDSYYSSAAGLISLGTSAVPLSASEEEVVLKTYHTEGHNYIQYIDSIHTATASQTLFSIGSFNFEPGKNELFVYINGVRQYPSAMTELAGNRVVFDSGLDSGDQVVFRVWKRSGSNVRQTITVLTASNGQTDFQMINTYILGYNHLGVYIDGVYQEPVESYTEISNNTIRFTEGLTNGSQILLSNIKYQ